MMFAIVTPAIISGAVVERMKFIPFVLFVLAWTTLVYDTIGRKSIKSTFSPPSLLPFLFPSPHFMFFNLSNPSIFVYFSPIFFKI
jgi:hypothetical protein